MQRGRLHPSSSLPRVTARRGRGSAHGLVASLAGAGLFLAGATAVAQTCDRSCPPAQRDGRGCCKAAPRPVRPPPAPPRPTTPPAPECPAGQEITQDTAGHCCWPGQAWATTGCVGRPTSCPAGLVATNTRCELQPCETGKVRTVDGVHCCWPNQGWRSSTRSCVGVPACPRGLQVEGEECVSSDLDGDGIPNTTDRCPRQAEDADGHADDDGCPEDDDGDGVADPQDRCPREAEDLNQHEDDDGCPDEARRVEAEAAARLQAQAEARALEAWTARQPKPAVGAGNALVTFYSEDPGVVETITHVGSGASCQTPCAMRVGGGLPQEFMVVGPNGVTNAYHIPTAGGHDVVEMDHFDGGQFAVGLTMFIGGLGVTLAGIPVLVTGAEDGDALPGAAMMIAGSAVWIPGEIIFLTAMSHFGTVDKPPVQVGGAPLPGGGTGSVRVTF